MSIYSTLKDLQQAAAKENTGGSGRSFLTLKSGESFKIRFRQELAEDGKNFDEDLGTGLVVPVHVHPNDFKRKLACTLEDEAFDFKCWPHEQVVANPKWRDKKHFLVNVAVLDNNEWSNKILDQTFSPKHVINALIEYALEYGSTTDREYKITRTGSSMNDTQYMLIPGSESKVPDDVAKLEVADLSTVYRKLPYDEQAEYFLALKEDSQPASKGW